MEIDRNQQVDSILDRLLWKDDKNICDQKALAFALIGVLGELVNAVDRCTNAIESKCMYSGI